MSKWQLKRIDEDYNDVLAENSEKKARIFNVLGKFERGKNQHYSLDLSIDPAFSVEAMRDMRNEFFDRYVSSMKREMDRFKPCLVILQVHLDRMAKSLSGSIGVWVAFKGDMDDYGDFQKANITVVQKLTTDIFKARFDIDRGTYTVFNKTGKEAVALWKKMKEDDTLEGKDTAGARAWRTSKYAVGSVVDLEKV